MTYFENYVFIPCTYHMHSQFTYIHKFTVQRGLPAHKDLGARSRNLLHEYVIPQLHPTVYPEILLLIHALNTCIWHERPHIMQCHNVTYPNTLHLDVHIYGLAQGCSNSIVLAMELSQPCAKPLTDHLSMGWCKGEITLVFSGLQLHIFLHTIY